MYGVHRFGKTNPFFGKKHTLKVKRLLSKIHKGKVISVQHREKVGNFFRGKRKSEEHKRKISLAHIGMKYDEDTKNKVSLSQEKYIYEIIDPNNKKIIISNLRKFCKTNNLERTSLRHLVHGKIKQYKNWRGRIISLKNKTRGRKSS
jgi:hypothetical protein